MFAVSITETANSMHKVPWYIMACNHVPTIMFAVSITETANSMHKVPCVREEVNLVYQRIC